MILEMTHLLTIILDSFAVLITVFIGFYTYFYWNFKYWKRRGIPFVRPTFPYGNLKTFSNPPQPLCEMLRTNYNIFKTQGHKHMGIYLFARPIYVPLNVEIVRNILTTGFEHFVDRGVYYNEKDDPLSAHLFTTEGDTWRNMRAKITPSFTPGKIKMVFETLVDCGIHLDEAMSNACAEKKPVDIKDMLERFTIDVIGSYGFGIECNCFKDTNSDFIKCGKRFVNFTPWERFKELIGISAPNLARKLKIVTIPVEVRNFILNVVEETVKYREENNVARKDFLQLLMEIKNAGTDEDGKEAGLTMLQLTAQVLIFFAAGYESAAVTLTFCLFELTQNLDLQERVRDEIQEVLQNHNGQVTYEALTEMEYMGQVIDETLRKHPAITFLNRICVKDYKLPDTDHTIAKGTSVLIPVLALHHDPEYFPEPDRFDPDRFSQQNRNSIVPYSYLPFGEGPRNCIGLRFGIVQTKIGLTALLKNYKFTLNEKTRLPLKMDPVAFVNTVQGDIWVDVEKI